MPLVGREQVGDGDRNAEEENENVRHAQVDEEEIRELMELAAQDEHANDEQIGYYAEQEDERENRGENHRGERDILGGHINYKHLFFGGKLSGQASPAQIVRVVVHFNFKSRTIYFFLLIFNYRLILVDCSCFR